MIGCTTDPAHGLTTADLQRAGFGFCRIVLRWTENPAEFLRACQTAGLPVIGIYTGESRAPNLNDTQSAVLWAAWLRDESLVEAMPLLQVGNEPDLESGSSWTMGHDEYNRLVDDVAPVFRGLDLTIVGAGLASGQPSWLAGVDQDLLDIIAVHPYGRRPNGDPKWQSACPEWANDVREFLAWYRSYTALPLAVSEYGGRHEELGDPRWRQYCVEMTVSLHQMVGDGRLAFAALYGLSEMMVPGMGMLYPDGRLTEAGRGVRSVLVASG